MSNAPILEIESLVKDFHGHRALKGVSLSVRQGEFMALVGPSGCGKTTLLKHVAGFETPTAGRLRIGGADMVGVPPAIRPTSMVFQKLALFPHMTVSQNIGFALRLRGDSTDSIRARVAEMMALMELRPEYAGRYPGQLSGGEQQRVALARSLARSPSILLLDEPLSALDVKLKKVLQAELKRLHRSLGVTFVHVTHDLEEAMMLADRICVMRGGDILQVGTPSEIYYRPQNSFVAGFIGDTNLIPIAVTAQDGQGIDFDCPVLDPGRGRLSRGLVAEAMTPRSAVAMVRPERVAILTPAVSTSARPFDFRIEVEIDEMFRKGSTLQYRAKATGGGGDRPLELIVEVPGEANPPAEVGDRVALGWRRDDMFVFPD